MKVCLIGYGKMGKAIEEILLRRSHTIHGKINHNNVSEARNILQGADIAIEFTNPESAVDHIKLCIDNDIPVVCGTTGWLNRWQEITDYLALKNGALIYASNFSVGVQLFFSLNRKLAKMMASHPEYSCNIHEIHHTHKKDAPSGTAISLATDIIQFNARYHHWSSQKEIKEDELKIISERMDPVVGTHSVNYTSQIDQLQIRHEAFSREGFAYGAVLASEWLHGKKGLFTMNDVLDLND